MGKGCKKARTLHTLYPHPPMRTHTSPTLTHPHPHSKAHTLVHILPSYASLPPSQAHYSGLTHIDWTLILVSSIATTTLPPTTGIKPITGRARVQKSALIGWALTTCWPGEVKYPAVKFYGSSLRGKFTEIDDLHGTEWLWNLHHRDRGLTGYLGHQVVKGGVTFFVGVCSPDESMTCTDMSASRERDVTWVALLCLMACSEKFCVWKVNVG